MIVTSLRQALFVSLVSVGLYAGMINELAPQLMVDEPLLLEAFLRVDTTSTPGIEALHLGKHYKSLKEQDERKYRFPSVQDRVKFYMGSWYLPPCDDNRQSMAAYRRLDNGEVVIREIASSSVKKPRIFVMPPRAETNRAFVIDPDTLHRRCERKYCGDTLMYVVPAMRRTQSSTPVVCFYSDAHETQGYPNVELQGLKSWLQIPLLKKFRLSFGGLEAVQQITEGECVDGQRPYPPTELTVPGVTRYQDIITRVGSIRHYDPLPHITAHDVPWSEKKDGASFRGTLTGERNDFETSDKARAKMTDMERCMNLPRCRLAYQTTNSTIVDAKLSDTYRKVPNVLNGRILVGASMGYKESQSYKGIIMIEGNDISTGLKWALYSNSVVLIPKPTKSSWMMEELLEPWVHYIPLKDDLSDVEEMTQWMLDNDEEAQRIAYQGSLWIKDLLFHPVAERQEEEIQDEMMRRLGAHFYEDETLRVPHNKK